MAKRKISGIINATEHPMNLETPWNQKQPDGTYVKPDKRGKTQINSQMEFCREATERAKAAKKEKKEKKRVFVPAEPAEDIIK